MSVPDANIGHQNVPPPGGSGAGWRLIQICVKEARRIGTGALILLHNDHDELMRRIVGFNHSRCDLVRPSNYRLSRRLVSDICDRRGALWSSAIRYRNKCAAPLGLICLSRVCCKCISVLSYLSHMPRLALLVTLRRRRWYPTSSTRHCLTLLVCIV